MRVALLTLLTALGLPLLAADAPPPAMPPMAVLYAFETLVRLEDYELVTGEDKSLSVTRWRLPAGR